MVDENNEFYIFEQLGGDNHFFKERIEKILDIMRPIPDADQALMHCAMIANALADFEPREAAKAVGLMATKIIRLHMFIVNMKRRQDSSSKH